MAKSRSAVADYSAYLVVRLFVCLLQSLTIETGLAIARGLAWLAYRVDKRHRNVALENLREAFPGRYSESELHELVRGVYEHFCGFLVELVNLPRKMRPYTWKKYMDLGDGDKIMGSLLSDRPVLVITGHYGNWEMAGVALAMSGFKSYAIARPLDNPYLDRYFRRFRQFTGQELINKKGDFDRLEGILKAGGVVATLGDQDAGQKGLFVDFFGRPASTHKAIALLAMEHQANLVVTAARKLGEPMQYSIEATDAMTPADTAKMSVRSITERFTKAFESLIRRDPRQYFWLHRRWKHQPLKNGQKVA